MTWQSLLAEKAAGRGAVAQIETAIQDGSTPEAAMMQASVAPAIVREAMALYYGVESATVSKESLPADELFRYIPDECQLLQIDPAGGRRWCIADRYEQSGQSTNAPSAPIFKL